MQKIKKYVYCKKVNVLICIWIKYFLPDDIERFHWSTLPTKQVESLFSGNWFKEYHKAEMTSEYVLPSIPKITDDLKNQTKTKGDRKKKYNLRFLWLIKNIRFEATFV